MASDVPTIRIKDGDQRIVIECTAITVELEDGRIIAWTGNAATHIGYLNEGGTIKILGGAA